MTMRRLTEILHGGGWSLVVDNGAIRTFSGRGVSDLYGLLTREPETLRGPPWRTRWWARAPRP